jgi:hypothetical protein
VASKESPELVQDAGIAIVLVGVGVGAELWQAVA